ncbi:MAG: YeeE/YedE family protein [Deltaproteobacteria bacterium]|nr:YeeE/YedE family protein [Deltaproteobacteria bacterium]
MLQIHHLEPLHWAVAGATIAGVTLVLQAVGRRSLGLSSGLEDLCSLASANPVFAHTAAEGKAWRLPFIAGLVLGGALSVVLAGDWQTLWRVEPLDSFANFSDAAKVAWLFAGGACTGFGVRLAGGCTSGHGIFGMSRLQPSSIRSTLAFMAVGTVFSNLMYRVVWG